jgi:HTH-type transcriptional regulator / antitoxin MqsA
MLKKRFCLQCDDGTLLAHGTKDLAITMGKLVTTVPAVSGWFCPVCADCQFDKGEGQRYGKALEELRQLANQQRAAAMRSTRKKLGLRQAEAGQIFGGGASAFSEYERGKTQPHKSTVLLLKLLDRHPELLPEVLAA